MVTDYDCWKVEEEPVTADAVIAHVMANASMARDIVRRVIPRIPVLAEWPEHRALDAALITDKGYWPGETVESLRAVLGRFL
jgi:5'-methylthioadenosine phosphorylase